MAAADQRRANTLAAIRARSRAAAARRAAKSAQPATRDVRITHISTGLCRMAPLIAAVPASPIGATFTHQNTGKYCAFHSPWQALSTRALPRAFHSPCHALFARLARWGISPSGVLLTAPTWPLYPRAAPYAGKSHTLRGLPEAISLGELGTLIERCTNVPVTQQRLFGGHPPALLAGQVRLSGMAFKKGDWVHACVR